MGGKFKIRKSLGAFINKNLEGRDYYEPFVGAAWVLGEVKGKTAMCPTTTRGLSPCGKPYS